MPLSEEVVLVDGPADGRALWVEASKRWIEVPTFDHSVLKYAARPSEAMLTTPLPIVTHRYKRTERTDRLGRVVFLYERSPLDL